MAETPYRFNANDARKLSVDSLDQKIDYLLVAIKLAAEKKRRVFSTENHNKHCDLWSKQSDEWYEAKRVLTSLGFEVEFYVNQPYIEAEGARIAVPVIPRTIIRW